MVPNPVLNRPKVLTLVWHLPIRESFLKSGVCVAHELLPYVVYAMQRVTIVARMLVNRYMRGDTVADSEETMQRMPQVDLVNTVVGSFRMWVRWGKALLLGPRVGDGHDAVR